MRQTNDQQTATEALRTQAGPYRVTLDAEGWPRIEGRYGQIEHHDEALLAVDSQAVRKLAPLVALGARRHQIGDEEYRLLFEPALLGGRRTGHQGAAAGRGQAAERRRHCLRQS